MSQLRWGGADLTTSNGDQVSVDPRYLKNKYSTTMLSLEATYSLSESSLLRLSANSLNTDYSALGLEMMGKSGKIAYMFKII